MTASRPAARPDFQRTTTTHKNTFPLQAPAKPGEIHESRPPHQVSSNSGDAAAVSCICPAVDILVCHSTVRLGSFLSRGFFKRLDRRGASPAWVPTPFRGGCLV